MPTKKKIQVRRLSSMQWEWWVEFRSWPDGTNTGAPDSPNVAPWVLNVYGFAMTRASAVRQARRTQEHEWETVEQRQDAPLRVV